MKKNTIKDVAALSGVSISTVSRVINGFNNVEPEYACRVQAAIEQLHFRPSTAARAIRLQGHQTIGLLLPNLSDPFFGSIANSVITEAYPNHQNVIVNISKVGEDSYNELTCFQELSGAPIDGLIYCPISTVDNDLIRRYFPNIPIVVCSRHDLISGAPHVYFNHRKGGYLVTKHLIQMGHQQIAFLVGVFGTPLKSAEELEPYLKNRTLSGPFSGIDKFIGARQALEEEGIPYNPELVDFIDLGNPHESGYSATQRLISKTARFDAIFASNDLSATGAIRLLKEQKIEVPKSVSVIGYDNGIMATCTQPQLSSVSQDTQVLGSQCVKSLNRLMTGESCDDVLIDVALIIRQSSCRHDVF